MWSSSAATLAVAFDSFNIAEGRLKGKDLIKRRKPKWIEYIYTYLELKRNWRGEILNLGLSRC